MKKYFITATGTEIGKTFICCRIIEDLLKTGYSVKAIKPIITGEDGDDADNARILKSLGEKVEFDNLKKTSPFSFSYPASPDVAARFCNKPYLDYDSILEYCRDFLNNHDKDFAFIEGIGGVMVPLNQHKLILDLIRDLDIEVILVAGNYLGTLSHTLTALSVLEGCKVSQIIVNDIDNDPKKLEQNICSLRNFFDGKITKYHSKGSNEFLKHMVI